jgi:hypothetical protein
LNKSPTFPISTESHQCPAYGVLAFPLQAKILNSFVKVYPLNVISDKRLSNMRVRGGYLTLVVPKPCMSEEGIMVENIT